MTVKRKFKLDPSAFVKIKCNSATLQDVEAAMWQVMQHQAEPKKKSENREPTADELNRRWKMTRRG